MVETTNMKFANFDFHGTKINLSAQGPSSEKALSWIAEDFNYFQTKASANCELKLLLQDGSCPPMSRGPRLFKTRMCTVFGLGHRRFCDYGDGSVVQSENWKDGRRLFNIYGPNENEIYEFTYVALLSVIGEALDLRGFHRVHALGVSGGKSAFVVLLPQGGGKSTMASILLKTRLSLLSDESPLLKEGMVYPFPNHIALAPALAKKLNLKEARLFQRKYFPSKSVFDVPREKVSEAKPLKALLIGRRWDGPPLIKNISRLKSFGELFRGIVVGEGIAQMAEFMLRGNNLIGLLRIAFARLGEAVQISYRVPCYEFWLGPNIHDNARILLEFVQSQSSHSLHSTPKKTAPIIEVNYGKET
jgi:hypothetical protein